MLAYLLDIEGTTTPIDFVHKILFPYSKENMDKFVREDFAELNTEIGQLVAEYQSDNTYTEALDTASPASVSAYLKYLIDVDRKSTPLKSIQGMIWKKGYGSGELKSQIFDDVPLAFDRWKAAGKTIAIYSSGSVLAQKLLFKYTDHGDLTPYLSAHFDTNVGAKGETASYRRIAEELNIKPEEITFVSDIPAELDAARSAGLQTALSIRDGNAPIDSDTIHQAITSFDALPG